MSILKISQTKVKPAVFAATAAFVALAALLFIPSVPHAKVCLPVGLLCIAALWLTPWEVFFALMFSALGDLAGDCNNFLAQMASFGVAHVFYILFFIRRYHRKVEPDRKLTEKSKGYLMITTFCTLGLLALIFVAVVPKAPAGIIRAGVGIYSVVICFMLIMAMLQRSMFYAFGALFFVISDFLLAWNMFVHQIPHAGIFILSTYYLAQWLLFVRATPYRVAHPIHLLRF